MTDEKLKELVASLAIAQKETDRQLKNRPTIQTHWNIHAMEAEPPNSDYKRGNFGG